MLTVVLESADGPRLVGVNAIVGPIPLFDFCGVIAMIFLCGFFLKTFYQDAKESTSKLLQTLDQTFTKNYYTL